MSKSLHVSVTWAAILLLVAHAVCAASAEAGDKKTGRIDLEASLEPADLAPGGTGVLRVKGTLLNEAHHIYAEGKQGMTYEPIAASGVSYDMAKASITKPHDFEDEYGDPHVVWEGTFELTVPVTLAADAAPDATLGIAFTYYGCLTDIGCYPPIKGHAATAALRGAGAAGAPPAKGGAAQDPKLAADAGPTAANAPNHPDGTATIAFDEAKGEVVVTFIPAFGWHMYGPASTGGNLTIEVEPVPAEGVTWGAPVMDMSADHIEMPYEVRIPVTRTEAVKTLSVKVQWQACQGDDITGTCAAPHPETLRIAWPGGGDAPPPPTEAPTQPKGELLFEVVEGDELGGDLPGQEDEASLIESTMEESPILGFGLIFLIGLGLAFTPCVLPIIPITVSVITGGNADIPKRRLSGLLATYVAGLGLAFATMGVVAAAFGGSLSAAFTLPAVQWGIAILFFLLAFSMAGVYEIQPPAWLMKLQGGAQKRSGSFLGAFLFGILGAIIASPCTAPAVAGMLIITAKTGNLVLGFTMFLSLGLGMGAVFFAAGALNFLMRPGPWMVWVRYVFGMLLFGAALYYLKSGGLISETVLWVLGIAIALMALVGVTWHLVTKEGEEHAVARVRGIKVAVLWALMIGVVSLLTRTAGIEWIYARDRDHLASLVEEAKAEGKPVVVDFWAQWCFYCKEYDKLIAGDPDLMALFDKVKRVKIDLTDDAERWGMRHAVGLEVAAQPYMVFIDKEGRIRRAADVKQWYGFDDGPAQLKARLAVVLGAAEVKTTDASTGDGTGR